MTHKIYEYEHIKFLSQNPNSRVVLIDVREPEEFQETNIPTSINVSYRSYPNGLAMDSETFFNTFKTRKPEYDKELVLLCASGRRASEALKVALEAGYSEVSLYPGSMKDWTYREKGGSTTLACPI
ncbi:hypothetical protein ZYGR_0A02580 [Zygosaccharomyces rouxii]|uniref:ZYRO0A05874p n=2 Tax=Zygosaccharomyces rouxii TaxID=4956 RepID=C5DPT1_ZYGRC|nr:uncharacterized protein ZYRO0A05874g [Zygosaccharomyces rouxii]KAH9198787.1 Rhodanese-like domain-containing protein [Zygosaccharomyces rouxii]GAV46665.1 hypothetical protein ZYGR_0A02580 [Zygosaccharomyces rouxii]CAR25692.1 ZYRO0A05874p [Zygosaccharomyces rouxii]